MALPSARDPHRTASVLAEWLGERVGAKVEVDRVGGPPATGFSNETIIAEARWDDGSGITSHKLVFRVEPSAHTVFPSTRFDIQHRVMTDLAAQPDTLVPAIRWVESDSGPLGSPFMVMDHVEGEAPSDNPPYSSTGWLLEAGTDVQRAVWERGLDAMAAIHRVDPATVAVPELDPSPGGGSRLGARLSEWAGMLRWASPEERQEVPEVALAWLRENQPPDTEDPVICWGDSRISNQLFSGRDSAASLAVAAVLDWEMVHLGDPIQDLGWFTWLDHTMSHGLDLPRLAGFPSIPETVERWEAATGRSGEHHRWAEILAGAGFAIIMVRLTTLLEGAGLFEPGSGFARTNMACTSLEVALAELDVGPEDLD